MGWPTRAHGVSENDKSFIEGNPGVNIVLRNIVPAAAKLEAGPPGL
jgi:hypothetical protein